MSSRSKPPMVGDYVEARYKGGTTKYKGKICT